MNWEVRLQKARRTNMKRDASDTELGFATPAEDGPARHLATALEAIRAGGTREDWDCVAEGVVMLEDLQRRLSQ